jgi:hypothetical protein
LRGVAPAGGRFTLGSIVATFASIALIGDEDDAPVIVGEHMLYADSPFVYMRGLTLELGVPVQWDEDDFGRCFPPLQVNDGATLHAVDLDITGIHGTAFMLDDGGSALLEHCTLSSSVQLLGVVAKSHTTITMLNNTICEATWGIYAGPDGRFLAESTKFAQQRTEKVTDMYSKEGAGGYSRQIVQPWREWKTRPLALRPPPLA